MNRDKRIWDAIWMIGIGTAIAFLMAATVMLIQVVYLMATGQQC